MDCTECKTSLQSGWMYCPVCGQKKPETLRPSEGRRRTQKEREREIQKRRKRRGHSVRIHNWCCYSCGYACLEESDEKYCPNCECYISEYGMSEGEIPVCNKCMDSDDVIPAGVRSKRYYCRKHGYSDTRCPDNCWSDIDGENFNRYAGAEYVCTYCKITVEKGCRYINDNEYCSCEWTPERTRRKRRKPKRKRRQTEFGG